MKRTIIITAVASAAAIVVTVISGILTRRSLKKRYDAEMDFLRDNIDGLRQFTCKSIDMISDILSDMDPEMEEYDFEEDNEDE